MKDIKAKIKRQSEILGLVVHSPYKYTIRDFECLFNVNQLTVKRDLKELRDTGIDIHAIRLNGIAVTSPVKDDILKNIIIQFTCLSMMNKSFDSATGLLVSKLKIYSISIITILQRAIEQKNKVSIIYEKPDGDSRDIRILEPYSIFQSDKNWRLLAGQDGTVKQFLLNRIRQVDILDKKITPVPQRFIHENFCYSFKNWIGSDRFKIKLNLSSPWNKRIMHLALMENQTITLNHDGSVTLEMVINSLKEIAGWIVSMGKGIEVIEPPELKSLVVEIAKATLSNYECKSII